MQTPPQLYDPIALGHRRRRTQATGMFLHAIAQEELSFRQADVNRTFTKVAVVGHFPEFWSVAGADHIRAEETLNFPAAGYDLIIHAMTLHQSNDPLGQMIQCKNHLRPDGLFLAAFLGGETLTGLRQVLTNSEIAQRGGAAPRVHPVIDVRDAGALMQRAGFALPVADTLPQTVSFQSVIHLMKDLRAMGEGNALAQRDKRFLPKSVIAHAEATFPKTNGRIEDTFELIFCAGWSPHDSQPKPLRPGSAKMSLLDALNPTKDVADD